MAVRRVFQGGRGVCERIDSPDKGDWTSGPDFKCFDPENCLIKTKQCVAYKERARYFVS